MYRVAVHTVTNYPPILNTSISAIIHWSESQVEGNTLRSLPVCWTSISTFYLNWWALSYCLQ